MTEHTGPTGSADEPERDADAVENTGEQAEPRERTDVSGDPDQTSDVEHDSTGEVDGADAETAHDTAHETTSDAGDTADAEDADRTESDEADADDADADEADADDADQADADDAGAPVTDLTAVLGARAEHGDTGAPDDTGADTDAGDDDADEVDAVDVAGADGAELATSAADLTMVQADDALLDALGGPDPEAADDLGDEELGAVLLAWRRDIDGERIPELVDVDTAVTEIKTASLARRHAGRGRKRRFMVPVAAAAAVLAIGFTGTALAARDAQPGDTLWGLSTVLYADHAHSVEAAASVRSSMDKARSAMASDRYEDARSALSEAEQDLKNVTATDEAAQLKARHMKLQSRLDDRPENPPAPPSSSEKDSSTTSSPDSPDSSSPDSSSPTDSQPLPGPGDPTDTTTTQPDEPTTTQPDDSSTATPPWPDDPEESSTESSDESGSSSDSSGSESGQSPALSGSSN